MVASVFTKRNIRAIPFIHKKRQPHREAAVDEGKRVIAEAREIGYSRMLLDTLPFLKSALRMYQGLGFYEIPCYNDSPMESSIYLALDL